jgi:lipopolysaccharide exporter
MRANAAHAIERNHRRSISRMTSPREASPAASRTGTTPGALRIGREMAKGTGWMIAARFSVQSIGFLSTIVLARLLAPTDFGLVALATTFSVALQAISEFSFDVVLIQNQQATREHYDTAWTLSVCRNIILAVSLIAAAGWLAEFFGDQRLEAVIYWLAAAEIVAGVENIGIIDFRKDLAFHKELVLLVLAKLGAFAITIPLALVWQNYWALVAGIVAGTILRVVLSYAMCAFRPRIGFARWQELMRYSKWLILNNICSLLFNRSNTFVIGKFAGAPAVGIYSVAFEIANMTTANLLAPLRRAIFPGFAKLVDHESLRTGFIVVLALVMLIGTPLAVGIGAVANPIVRVMLGDRWVDSVALIEVLSIYGFLGLVSSVSAPVFLAIGRPQLQLWVLLMGTIVLIPSLIIGTAHAGALGAAWAVTFAAAVRAVTDFVLISRLLRIPVRQFVTVAYRPLVASVVMIVMVLEVQASWPTPMSTLGWSALLAAAVGAGAILYAGVVIGSWALAGFPDGGEKRIETAIRNATLKVFKIGLPES